MCSANVLVRGTGYAEVAQTSSDSQECIYSQLRSGDITLVACSWCDESHTGNQSARTANVGVVI